MKVFTMFSLFFVLFALITSGPRANAQTVVNVIVKEGDMVGGTTVSSINAPFTDGNGKVGFTGVLADGDRFIWYDSGAIFLNSSAVGSVLTGAEPTMGVSNAGGFVFSPAADGDDALWNENGLLIVENTPAPDFPIGTNSTFHSRPTLSPDGTAYWVAGTNDMGGTATLNRVLYKSAPGSTPVGVLRSGDVIDGLTIETGAGIDFDYDSSDDNNHLISILDMATGSALNDGVLYVDGSIVAQEGSASGSNGENWDNFDIVSINNSGNYIFTGDTDGATGTDEFVAYNGSISIREGDTIDGIILGSTASLRAASINNNGFAVHIWAVAGGNEIVFYGPADDLANSVVILQTGETIDDGNLAFQTPATVSDLNASTGTGPGVDLADDGNVFLEVDLDFGAGDIEAIIGVNAAAFLPVELTSFSAVQNGAGITLNWATASETNNAGFEVQMQKVEEQVASVEWEGLGFVNGAGTTLEVQKYSYDVTTLPSGNYRFRLKQLDFDGASEFSPIVEVTNEVSGSFALSEAYPNPFRSTASFTLALPSEQAVRVDLYDQVGRHVRNVFDGTLPAHQQRTFQISGDGLAGGVYVYQLTTPTFTESGKVTFLK